MVSVRAEPADGGWVCEVVVEAGGRTTQHSVGVSAADLERWGTGRDVEAVEDLVRRSIDFLLDREPAGSILRRFDLSVIQRYFPEYDDRFRRRAPG